MHIHIISLFAQELQAFAQIGVIGRALQSGKASLSVWNPRDFTQDAYQTVDDRPYGGGPGMVMKADVLRKVITEVKQEAPKGSPVIYLSPQGVRFNQQRAKDFADLPGLILLAGRYEGIDQRVIEQDIDLEISLGDFVLSGGELPALSIMDAVIRMLPDVLGDNESALQDSFMQGLLDCPHYTRPEVVDGQAVPEVLLSGDHQKIAAWRLQAAQEATKIKRPDLWNQYSDNKTDK